MSENHIHAEKLPRLWTNLPQEAEMIPKPLAVVATSTLILAGTTATASAQSAAPYPSSQIPVDQGIVQTV